MSLYGDKTVYSRVWGVTTQNSDVRLTTGDSAAGTFTSGPNPFRGTLVWDDMYVVLTGVAIAGGATGGSYTIAIETDAAVVGYTGLPIFRSGTLGPNSPTTVVLPNLHNSQGSPLPTHIFIDQTATGGGINFQCHIFGKQYRGVLGTVGAASAERVIRGTMLRGASFAGGPFTDSRGFDENSTLVLGTSGSNLGLDRMRTWDRAFYWVQAGNSVAGTHNVTLISTVNGVTYSFAGTTAATTGVISAANQRLPIISFVGGQSPNPTQIIWTEVTAGGVSDARVIVLAKTGRGQMQKS